VGLNRLTSNEIGIILAVLSAAGFSLKAIFVKQAYLIANVEPITLLSLRMLFSFPLFILIGYSSLKTGFSLTNKEVLLLILLGVAGYYGASILDFMGLEYISAGLERIILFSYPILTIFMGVLFLGKQFEKRLVVPTVLCTLGVVCACLSDFKFAGGSHSIWLGAALVFGSALCYAFYQAFSEPMIEKLGAMRFSLLAMFVSIFAVQLHFFIQLPIESLIQPTKIYTICFMMALFSTVLPVFLQSSAIKYIGAARSVLVSTLGPILTLILGWILLDEKITLLQVLGMCLVLIGVLAIKRKRV
tara:strand:- start:608 stop:1513 length:906 start_codon:yes stop_codon:yes gene_type:complete